MRSPVLLTTDNALVRPEVKQVRVVGKASGWYAPLILSADISMNEAAATVIEQRGLYAVGQIVMLLVEVDRRGVLVKQKVLESNFGKPTR